MKKTPARIEGKKVTLRRFKLSDAPSIYKYINNKEVCRWTARIPYPYPKKGAVEFIRRSRLNARKGQTINYAITLKGAREPVGSIGLKKIDMKNRQAEIGYWLGQPFWGQGIMTEAVRLMVNFGFENLKFHRIYAGAFLANKGSAKVLLKNGFKREGLLRDRWFRFGRWQSVELYSRLEPARRK